MDGAPSVAPQTRPAPRACDFLAFRRRVVRGARPTCARVCVCVCVWIGVVGLKKNTQPENCDSTFYSGSYCRLQPGRQPLRSSEGTAPKKKRDRPVYM